MRVKPELAAVVLLSAVGVSLAVGTLAGLALARSSTDNSKPAAHQAPAPCPRQTITT